ncbi:hypothetical protein OKW45_003477 [Paraburkholderia sp. WSM4175]
MAAQPNAVSHEGRYVQARMKPLSTKKMSTPQTLVIDELLDAEWEPLSLSAK